MSEYVITAEGYISSRSDEGLQLDISHYEKLIMEMDGKVTGGFNPVTKKWFDITPIGEHMRPHIKKGLRMFKAEVLKRAGSQIVKQVDLFQ